MPAPTPSRRVTVLLALVGGALTRLAFPDPGWWGLAPVGVALLWWALRRDSARWNCLVGLLWGLTFFLPLITWADDAVGPVPWVALSVAEAAFVGLLGAAWGWARRGEAVWRSGGLQVVVFALLWVAVEELRSAWPFGGFPWGRLAFSQASSPLVAYASWAGTPLVSGVVAAGGVLLGLVALRLRRGQLLRAPVGLAAAAALLAVGWQIPLDARAQDGELRVGAVQGDVPGTGLEAFGRARQVLDNHLAGTRELAEHAGRGALDVVLWPENGSDIDPQVDLQAAAGIDAAARALGAPILVGAVEYPESGGRYNVSLLWQPGQGVTDRYAKQHPAPFAEYIPFRELVRPFSSAVDLVVNDMLPGTTTGVVAFDSPRLGRTVQMADAICFEVAYDALVRDGVRAGGEIIVVPTNNASFGFSDEAVQQLAMSQLRAVEHGRATVQISTVGVSAVILPDGVITHRTGLFTTEQLVADLPLRQSLTWATRLGPWPAWVVDALAVLTVLAGAAGARRTRRADRVDGL
ncbi:apolipoprotein N-acyltransferase [Cellulomonas marina]|uniref:apolipoprotein N-acyltransferase n=1 Tax=Cellulomonas marina TaxID=988821 RepID=UPI000B7DFA26|nr:apolipoprotein N-acyltransferase [Cellulomonas marina]